MRQVRRRVLPAIAVGLAIVAAACVPSEIEDVRQLEERPGGQDAAPPTFPAVGSVPADLVVDGVLHDLTTRPIDGDYWAPLPEEAACAAEQIVATIGADRLAGLGYRPGTAGASLNDVDLGDDERLMVVDAFDSCVDMVEGLAAVLYGKGRMPPRMATCVAEGLGRSGHTTALVSAWAEGRAVDPFADGSDFASALLGHAEVCIPAQAFNWPDVHLPDDRNLIDSDLPAGSSRSPYVDDAPSTTSTTTTTAAPTESAP